jgi:serine/threonine-protein kinase
MATANPTYRMRELFEMLVDLDAPARARTLDGLGLDPPTAGALVALLAGDARALPVLQVPAAEVLERWQDRTALAAELIGQRIGSFVVVDSIGHGGSSLVLRAQRAAGDGVQTVALKLLRAGLFTADARRRFAREQAILAQLSHPNIARLIEGGVSANGVPYIAMELVEGLPITEHAERHALAIPQRLRLALMLCRAVEAAHIALVVHRDLKPSNVLVAGDGAIKVVDFGIAKLLDDDSAQPVTQAIMLTPEYAAPEQFHAGPITTATDVYALGVLLGELLTAQRLGGTAGVQASALAQTGAVLPRGLPERGMLVRSLRGDLDAILATALAEEPARRYRSAGALADDIERYLGGRAVQAHPPSRWYRARKFVRRHRAGVLLTSLLSSATLIGLVLALWQAQVAREQAITAQLQAARATQIRDFVEEIFRPLESGTALNSAPSLQDLVRRALQRLDTEHPADPELRADLLAMFARINDGIGETQGNRKLSHDAYLANRDAYGDEDLRAIGARNLYARVLRKIGDLPAARKELEDIRRIMRAEGIAGQEYARLLDALSLVMRLQGDDPAEAVELEREALDARLAQGDATPDDLATGYNNLGGAYLFAADFANAMAWYRKAYEINRQTQGDSVDTASTLLNVGAALASLGQWRDAEQTVAQAREIARRIPLERHPFLGFALMRHCGLLIDLEELRQAEVVCGEAEATVIALYGEHHNQFFELLLRRARLRMAQGNTAAALADFASARELAGSSPPIGLPGETLYRIADAWQARWWWMHNDFATLGERMSRLLDPGPGDAQDLQLRARTPGAFFFASLAVLACDAAPTAVCAGDRTDLAQRLLAQPQASASALRLPARLALAEAALIAGEPEAAIAPIERLLVELDRHLGPHHSLRAHAALTLAALCSASGRSREAREHAERGMELLEALPNGHPLRGHRALLDRVPGIVGR